MVRRTSGIVAIGLLLAACASSPPSPDPVPAQQRAAELDPPEQALRDRVQALLVERLGDDARGIRVHVEGTSLWLSGRAPGRLERDRARDAAHEVPGVTRVDVRGLAVQ